MHTYIWCIMHRVWFTNQYIFSHCSYNQKAEQVDAWKQKKKWQWLEQNKNLQNTVSLWQRRSETMHGMESFIVRRFFLWDRVTSGKGNCFTQPWSPKITSHLITLFQIVKISVNWFVKHYNRLRDWKVNACNSNRYTWHI